MAKKKKKITIKNYCVIFKLCFVGVFYGVSALICLFLKEAFSKWNSVAYIKFSKVYDDFDFYLKKNKIIK